MMFKNKVYLILAVLLVVHSLNYGLSFSEENHDLKKKILILYEERSFYGDNRDSVTAIENLLGHYQTEVEELKISEQGQFRLSAYDYVLVLAMDQDINRPKFYDALSKYEGEIIWLGKSIEPLIKLKQYPIEYKGEVFDLLSVSYKKALTGDEKSFSIGTKRAFYKITSLSDKNRVYSWLSDGKNKFPFIIKSDNLYYISRVDINEPLFYIFSDFIGQLFYEKNYQENRFLISIEDVHVFSDYNHLKELATLLYDNQMPFTIGLVPYIQQEGADYVTSFTEVSEFVETLKFMQAHGGSIILHTYIHEMNDNKLTLSNLEERDIKQFFNKAISECLQNGLVPIGYEAPHAFLSQNEYDALKSMFNTAFGQVSITENNYIIYPYELYDTSSFNKLYPFNLGYINPSENDAFKMIDDRLERIELVNGFFAGIYFHSSVETTYLERLIQLLKEKSIQSYDPLQDYHTILSRDFDVIIDKGRFSVNSYLVTKSKSPLEILIDKVASTFSLLLLGISVLFILILIFSIRRQRKNIFR